MALNRKAALAATLACLLAFAGMTLAAQFSADFVEQAAGQSAQGKIYVKDLKVRREVTKGPQQGILIYRMDKRVAWLLNPADKTYVEMPAGGKEALYTADDAKLDKELAKYGTRKKVGQETVGGYLCDKYAFVYHDKNLGTQYHWVARKLKLPIKVEQKSQRFQLLVEYRNIKERKLADSLFEVPKGYQKKQMPQPTPQGGRAPAGRRGPQAGGRRGR